MEKKFYHIETEYEVTNINIDYIREWRVNWEGELRVSLDSVTYGIPYATKGYDELLKVLKEKTV